MKYRIFKCWCLVVLLGSWGLRAESVTLYAMDEGRWNAASGEFTHEGQARWQGLVASFPAVELAEMGGQIHVGFIWLGGSDRNNSGQRIAFGLFQGEPVTGHRQTAVTDEWTGYFHAIGSRNSSSGGVSDRVVIGQPAGTMVQQADPDLPGHSFRQTADKPALLPANPVGK